MVNTGDMSVNPGNTSTLVYKYMRPEHLPHIWCPGCGNGIIMRDVAQAIENLGLSRNKTVIVSGIGCSSRAAGYLDFNTIHTTHGRAIAFATGIKLANPELEVIVLAGDGDISAIGGNHLIHAAMVTWLPSVHVKSFMQQRVVKRLQQSSSTTVSTA